MTPPTPGPGADVDADADADADAANALRRAARRGEVAAVRRLLEAGTSPDDGRALLSPLALAARSGRGEVVALLLDHGADPARTTPAGWTAATFADAEGYDDIARRVVAAGAPADSPTAHGYGPLHRAARRGDVDALRHEVRSGRVDALDAQGDTPLVLAVRHRHERAADLLLAAGADTAAAAAGAGGWSALAEAAYQDSVLDRSTALVERLLVAGADPNPAGYPPLLCTVNQEGSSAAVLRRLVAAGADVAAAGADGETVLHRIAALAGATLVDAALDASAPIEARDDRGRTPLLAAADATNAATFRRLAERGADVDARDHAGRSATDVLEPASEADAIRALIRAARRA